MTTPEQLAQYVANLSRKGKKQPVLDHIPTAAEVLSIQLTEAGIPHIYDKFEFHPWRKYRADIAIPKHHPWLIVECDGGGFSKKQGAHHRGKGYEDDRERDAEALMLGYVVLRVTPRQIMNMKALHWVQRLVRRAENNEEIYGVTE